MTGPAPGADGGSGRLPEGDAGRASDGGDGRVPAGGGDGRVPAGGGDERVPAGGDERPRTLADAMAGQQPGRKPSGLRNPQAAVRGLGAGTLTLEAIVLLLAIQPIRLLGGDLGGWGIAAVVTLAVLCFAVAGSMKRSWAWPVGTVIQVLLLASGLFHWSLAALGLIFGAAWAYAAYVRRSILG